MTPLLVIVAVAPQDPPYAAAVEARLAGRTSEAVVSFERLSRERPADPDVWLNLGLSYSAAERYDNADRALVEALRLAPDYADARLAYARSALYRGDRAEAQRRLAPLVAAKPDDPEVRALAARIADARTGAAPAFRLDFSAARSRLTQGLPDWTSVQVAASRSFADGYGLQGSLEHTRRFGVDDLYAELVGERRGNNESRVYVAAGGAADADYRAQWAVRAGYGGEAGRWLQLGIDGAWSHYRSGDVRSLNPSVRLGSERASVTLMSINTVDEANDYRSGYLARVSLLVAAPLRLQASLADAPESSEGVTVDVRAVGAGAALQLDDRTSLFLGVLHEDRAAYDRSEVSVALARRF